MHTVTLPADKLQYLFYVELWIFKEYSLRPTNDTGFNIMLGVLYYSKLAEMMESKDKEKCGRV